MCFVDPSRDPEIAKRPRGALRIADVQRDVGAVRRERLRHPAADEARGAEHQGPCASVSADEVGRDCIWVAHAESVLPMDGYDEIVAS